jgi:hypothetical protein
MMIMNKCLISVKCTFTIVISILFILSLNSIQQQTIGENVEQRKTIINSTDYNFIAVGD